MAANITLSEIIAIKGGTIEELCQYAKSKGITIPNSLDYQLSPSELKAIDPMLAFKLKYKRDVTSQEKGEEKGIVANQNKLEITKEHRDDSETEELKTKKKKNPKRLIGIVKFYDSDKEFGFAVSNNKGIDENPEKDGTLYSFYVTGSEWNSPSSPTDGEWIVFTPLKTPRGWSAINATHLKRDSESLLLAMIYRGRFAKIKGYNKNDYYDKNVLCELIRNIPHVETIEAFCQYIADMPIERKESTIKQFIADPELNHRLFRIFTEEEYSPSDFSKLANYSLYTRMLTDQVFDSGGFAGLSKLPESFDFTPYTDKLIELLVKEALYNSVGVEDWLKQHDIYNKFVLDNTAINTIPLRLVLARLTNSNTWIDELDVDWPSIRQFIKNNTTLAYSYCMSIFYGKDEQYVSTHKIADLLDDEFDTISNWCNKLMNEEHVPTALLRSLMEYKTNVRWELWNEYVQKGFDATPSYSFLRNGLNVEIKENANEVRSFLRICKENNIAITDILGDADGLSDEMYLQLFVSTGDYEYLNKMQDFDASSLWVSQQPSEFVISFIKQYGELIDDVENDTYIQSLGEDKAVEVLNTLSDDEQFQLIRYFPQKYATDIISSHFADSKLFDLFIGEQWAELKSQLPYLVFDLESDGENVREFAFCSADYIHYYEDQNQLNTLINEINSKQIIVGHRIKQWDLKILESYGRISPAFVWDTLEVEILLDPCKYAYSLHTTHNAKDDTELTNRLFWNQLFRLAMNDDLCLQLKDFLPTNINSIVAELRQPNFIKFFKKSGGSEETFYQTLRDIDDKLINKLDAIDEECANEPTIIIAPQRLWNRISEHIRVSFVREDHSIDYMVVSEKKLKETPLVNPFLQAVLLRFCQKSKTPIVSNLATYLRIQYFGDELLQNYVTDEITNIQCADIRVVNSDPHAFPYKKVFFIGCELENRLNQFSLSTHLRPTDFWNINSSIPMRLGGSSYIHVTKEERETPLFADLPADVANVWIERTKDGRYIVNYNFNFFSKLKNLKEKLGINVIAKDIPWTYSSGNDNSVFLVRSGKPKRFDFTQKRVNATARYRSMYWLYQMALLNDIHNKGEKLPIIYILDNDLELKQVEQYAMHFGFYIPQEGTLVSKLESIAQRPNGLLIVSKDKFFDITEKRLYTPYCYVWDQMAVEKHMMMWQNTEGKVDASLLNDNIEESGAKEEIGGVKDTYQSVLQSLWPIYQYYYRFILANNSSSRMYILDSFLEEYHTLSSVWNTQCYTSGQLWETEEGYAENLSYAHKIFGENSQDNFQNDRADIDKAMDVILATMVPVGKNGERNWSEIQKQVLPEILSKKENYLISIPTGGGKSVLFQGPALYNASYTNHLSIVVTPLKALMQDQVNKLSDLGFLTNVDYLNSDKSYQETRSIYRKINSGELALLYVTPERFRSRAFINSLMTRMMNDKGLEYMVFDEAHCISQWGMEFRPEYLNVINKCKELSETFKGGMCMAMFSATVTDMIYNQISEYVPVKRLGQENDKKTYNPIRSHIGTSFQLVVHDMDSRIRAIVSYMSEKKIDFNKSRMLVFCRTRNQCEELAAALPSLLIKEGILRENDANERVGFFHAGLDADDRNDTYERFKSNDNPIYILCATKAFGMGMDIPNIHYIVHLSPPNVLEDYLQEVGRAGREEKMYKNAGFDKNNPIPTVCLYSTEDIKKSREQLLQSMLSWRSLEEIRSEIVKYITKIQTIEKTKTTPVVIPNTLWSSSENDYEHTDFKLGEYWLERLGRIKMGYLSTAHITIKILKNDAFQLPLFSSREGAVTKDVYDYLVNIANKKDAQTIQVSLQKLAGDLSVQPTKVLNELITCAKYKLISINQECRCRIANTRIDEVPYLLKNPSVELAFHIIFNAAEKILQDNALNKEKTYSDKEIRGFMDMSSLDGVLKKVLIKTEDGKTQDKFYMPWYNENEKGRNKGLSVAGNYKRDLMGKRFRQIFATLFDIIPDVKCKSYIDTEEKAIKQSILICKNTWKEFLPDFKHDCMVVLRYIYDMQKDNQQFLDWASAINKLNIDNKGFSYFSNILRYLSGMAYIVTDSLLPMGVEVCTTDISEQPILEDTLEDSRDYETKMFFEESMQIRNLRLCVMDALTTRVKTKEDFQELISAYFSKTDANGFIELLSKYYDDSDSIWDTIRETAIKNAEEKMKDNHEQWAIYSENSNVNINVEAGPGSGKTHVLTMRCAKLIYRQHVRPEQILVLAYNRAVVVELKTRLNKLFTSLGLSRSASQLHVYTFHGLAKRVCGEAALDGLEMKEWEYKLLSLLEDNPIEVTKVLGDIQFILIDEFQDITQTRLDAMFELDKIYHPSFFTIGDRDQSIYGFEKEESMDPEYYYRQLYDRLAPKKMTMTTNYRSYPKILTEASQFLSEGSDMPVPCQKNKDEEPTTAYTFVYNNERNWADDFQGTIQDLKRLKMTDVAVFFRTNNEVYHGYSLIRTMNIPDVRIRIQGASECELFRKREIYYVINKIEQKGNILLELENDQTKNWIRNIVSKQIADYKNWDSFYLDFAYTLALDYLKQVEGDEETHTYADMADSIKQSLAEDNPQLYKIYDEYQDQRLLHDKQMNVVLTTMHKVKGLEFDAVIVTPSVASLPFDPQQNIDMQMPLTKHDAECIEEEKRLLYVAFTRARKYLKAYLGPRENAVINMSKYEGDDTSLGIREKQPGLDNYNIGYNAGYNFRNNSAIVNCVEKNAPVSIQKYNGITRNGQAFHVYNVVCNGSIVGQLSSSSTIAQAMDKGNISILQGFFVSDVFYWTYQDTLSVDQRNNKNYASKWCDEARKQGYIYVVSISGYGK